MIALLFLTALALAGLAGAVGAAALAARDGYGGAPPSAQRGAMDGHRESA
jgi:hypothetical protein